MILQREDRLWKVSGKVKNALSGNTKVERDRIFHNLILDDSAQHDLNMRMDEDEALQEAIKRSLNC